MTFAKVAAAEKDVQGHDLALANLAAGLEDWLAGRSELETVRSVSKNVEQILRQPLALPRSSASKVGSAEQALLAAVNQFSADKTPDADGQRALFEKLNGFTRERATVLLQWRADNNRVLIAVNKSGARARYLGWEASWIPLWKAEVDITYRLQRNALAVHGEDTKRADFVRELLGVQSKAVQVAVPKGLEALQELAIRRLTLLARTAEQLDRLGRGESRGALTRVRRLSKEQAQLGKQLQDQRLAILTELAKK